MEDVASKQASDFSKVSLDYKTVRYLICATLCLKRCHFQIGVKDAETKKITPIGYIQLVYNQFIYFLSIYIYLKLVNK